MFKKYDALGIVGEGAYGIVYKCRNKETGKFVAIKKFKKTQDLIVRKTMKRELAILQQIRHENIVELIESFFHEGHFFLVFEYIERNLLEVLEISPNGLPPKIIKSIIYQICKALSYLHKNNLIHRDIKPENLLTDENYNIKLCDFGLTRTFKLDDDNNNSKNEMTDYVATRWYRAPELLLSGGRYGPDVDFWAVGCIMGELADGKPLFPGHNETDQINCIIKVLGNLPEELENMFSKNPIFEGKKLLHVSRPESLERRYLRKLGPTAIDFLKGLLQLDPKKRLNAETVFNHKYFANYKENEKDNYINNEDKNSIPYEKEHVTTNLDNKDLNDDMENKEIKKKNHNIELDKKNKLNFQVNQKLTEFTKDKNCDNKYNYTKIINPINIAHILNFVNGNNKVKIKNLIEINQNNYTNINNANNISFFNVLKSKSTKKRLYPKSK